MIISDLSYFEVFSEVPTILGGSRKHTTKVKQKAKVTVRNSSVGGSITATNESFVVSSNDDL